VAVELSREARAPAPATGRARSRLWWPLAWLAVAAVTARLVRLPGPATLDPDEHAAALYLDRLVHGQRLEEPLLSTPKPLLTLVHGSAWALTHDWRVLEALAVAAFALAVVALARAAGRLGGAPAGLAAAVAVAGSGALALQAARGNSLVFALAGWGVALGALARDRRRWGLAAAALGLAALARSETWPLLLLAAALGVAAWRRGERRALWLLPPLAAPLAWLVHDRLLTGDLLYSLRVPERYTDLVAGRHPVAPPAWAALVGRHYGAAPLLLLLAALGVAWLARRRAWLWLAGLATVTPGLLVLFGLEAWRGTYVSWRYLDPVDLGIRLAAAFGAAWPASALAGRLARSVGEGRALRRAWSRGAGLARAAAGPAVAVLLAGAACWPLAPADPLVRSTLDRDTRLSANAATATRLLRPVAAEPGAVIAVSGPQRVRVALELGLPLGRVRDLFLATLHAPLDQALAGSAAVFHDADGDRPGGRFAPLSVTHPSRVGRVELVPLGADPHRGLYVHRVRVG
jgi:hypothetical protein